MSGAGDDPIFGATAGADKRGPRILLTAVEPSADAIGAGLMRALKARAPDTRFCGCGGPLMAEEGLTSLFPISDFAVIGPVGALKALPAAMRGAVELAQAAAAENIDAGVLIDSWSFSRIAAEKIKQAAPNAKLIKYVAPQVWASRPQRTQTVARLFDGVLTLFDFENPYFEKADVPVTAVGSSLFAVAASATGDGTAFRAKHGLGAAPLLAALPGSRDNEINRLAAPFGETIRLLIEAKPDLRVFVVTASGKEENVRAATAAWPGTPIYVGHGDRFDGFAAADAGLAASGTVTTELAIAGTPMVIGYRVDPLSAMWIRRVATINFVALINLAANREIIPEYLQEDCRPGAMAAALAPLMTATPERAAQLEAFPEILKTLGVGGPPPSEMAADAILRWIASD